MILDNFSLAGKVAIVTGCSTGLGQGIALGLAEARAHIVGVDYVEAPETKAKVEALGKKFLGITANLMTTEPVQAIIDKAVKEFGKVDILVNNAGIIRRQDAIEFTEQNWDDVININLKSTLGL